MENNYITGTGTTAPMGVIRLRSICARCGGIIETDRKPNEGADAAHNRLKSLMNAHIALAHTKTAFAGSA